MTFLIVLFAGLLYGLFDFFVAKGSSANAYLANVIFNGLGALIPLVFLLPNLMRHHAALTSKSAFIYNILAGVFIAAFSIILVKLFARGDGLGYVLPVAYGSAIVFAAILGKIFLNEKVSLIQLAGIILVAAGIALVAIAKRSTV